MSLVLDASLTVSWYFDDEAPLLTDITLDRVSENGPLCQPVASRPMHFIRRSGESG